MTTLIIDTSTDKAVVAFVRGSAVLLPLFFPPGTKSSQTLMSAIYDGFNQLGLTVKDLNAIAACVGPGSYTGTRVGLAAAYGLALPRALPLISFCSLEGFVPQQDGPFASLIDARIGGAYVLLQEKSGNSISPFSPPSFIEKEDLPSYLENYPVQVGPHLSHPCPRALARLVTQKLAKGEVSEKLDLLYLRTPAYTSS